MIYYQCECKQTRTQHQPLFALLDDQRMKRNTIQDKKTAYIRQTLIQGGRDQSRHMILTRQSLTRYQVQRHPDGNHLWKGCRLNPRNENNPYQGPSRDNGGQGRGGFDGSGTISVVIVISLLEISTTTNLVDHQVYHLHLTARLLLETNSPMTTIQFHNSELNKLANHTSNEHSS